MYNTLPVLATTDPSMLASTSTRASTSILEGRTQWKVEPRRVKQCSELETNERMNTRMSLRMTGAQDRRDLDLGGGCRAYPGLSLISPAAGVVVHRIGDYAFLRGHKAHILVNVRRLTGSGTLERMSSGVPLLVKRLVKEPVNHMVLRTVQGRHARDELCYRCCMTKPDLGRPICGGSPGA